MTDQRFHVQPHSDIEKRSYTEEEAAYYIRMSMSFLRKTRLTGKHRSHVKGPRYIRIGKAIRYLKEDLDDFLSERRAAAEVGGGDTL